MSNKSEFENLKISLDAARRAVIEAERLRKSSEELLRLREEAHRIWMEIEALKGKGH